MAGGSLIILMLVCLNGENMVAQYIGLTREQIPQVEAWLEDNGFKYREKCPCIFEISKDGLIGHVFLYKEPDPNGSPAGCLEINVSPSTPDGIRQKLVGLVDNYKDQPFFRR